MHIQRLAAFSDGDAGGNPAGVAICAALPDAATMQAIAADIGYSETAFAAVVGNGWRVRYFAPAMEVPFCGHATIALGAALVSERGAGTFALTLNDAAITVEGRREGALLVAALQSPPTKTVEATASYLRQALQLFSYAAADLDPRIAPVIAEAGARHLVLALKSRALLSAMRYDQAAGRVLMNEAGLATIMLVYAETPQLFHARNPFAPGGVYEDPATGAAAAAFAGYLRDLGWPHGGVIDVVQGEDMGMRSRLHAEIPSAPGTSIRVSGTARMI